MRGKWGRRRRFRSPGGGEIGGGRDGGCLFDKVQSVFLSGEGKEKAPDEVDYADTTAPATTTADNTAATFVISIGRRGRGVTGR